MAQVRAEPSFATRVRVRGLTLRVSLVVGLLGLSFVWGFLSHRQRLFPFYPLQRAFRALGWVESSTHIALEARSSEGLAPLLSLPYSGSGRRRDVSGIAFADVPKMSPGFTFLTYNAGSRSVAELLDEWGHVVYRWKIEGVEQLQLATVLPEGDLIVIDQGLALLRLNRRGRVLWKVPGAFHHSIELQGDHLITLRSHARVHPRIHPEASVLDEEIVVLDLEGRELHSTSVLDALVGSPFEFLLPAPATPEIAAQAPGRNLEELELDLFHANQALPLAGTALADSFGMDAVLVSLRNLNLLVTISPKRGAIWGWGPGRLVHPHHPTVLPNGQLLVFNNGRARSEILEVDPATGRATWRYAADDFFTPYAGSCQRLPNGNTLVTESASGRVFEITASGERVWTWLNPDRLPDGARAALYRAQRYPLDALPFLPQISAKN